MRYLATLVILTGVSVAQLVSSAEPKSALVPSDPPTTRLEVSSNNFPDLPAMPQGKSTVIGGVLREVDNVRDQLTLNVFGGKAMKVLFDERTQFYRDGKITSLRDLHAGDHVSVETMLDGTAIFARSIHMLSLMPEGECRGQVLRYDRRAGELVVRDLLSPDPVRVHVSSGTRIVREGQESSSGELTAGMLIAIRFQTDRAGHNMADKISVLATPGGAFVFSGRVSFLDLRSGLLVLIDARDGKRYEISFDPSSFVVNRDVREGTDVTVTASFDGSRYSATNLTVKPPANK